MAAQQGDRQVVEFTLDFCKLAAESGWNEPALIAAFRCRLNEDMNFIIQGIIEQLQITVMELTTLMELNTIDGGPIGSGIITHRTPQHRLSATMSKSRSLSQILPSTLTSLATPGFASTT